MKKCATVLNCVLLFFVFLLPVGKIICACFGYNFELVSNFVYVVLIAVLSVAAVIVNLIAKTALSNKFLCVLFAISITFFILGCFYFLFEIKTKLFVGFVLTATCCCIFLAAKFGKPLALKIVSIVLSAIMIINLVFFGFIGFIFGNIGVNTVVKSVDSPSGRYCAEVIDSDQGALGGDTVVKVSSNRDLINVYFFRVYKQPETVYIGEWLEYKGMTVYWQDDNCLVINSREYQID